jgi:hypothetical protein
VDLRVGSTHRLLGALPATHVKAMPGGGFMAVEGGMQWQAAPQRGPTLGWWLSGQIRLPGVGEVVRLMPEST